MKTRLLLLLFLTAGLAAAATPALARRVVMIDGGAACGAARVALRVRPPLTLSPHAEVALALRAREAPCPADPTEPAGRGLRLSGRLSLGRHVALVAALQYDRTDGLRTTVRPLLLP